MSPAHPIQRVELNLVHQHAGHQFSEQQPRLWGSQILLGQIQRQVPMGRPGSGWRSSSSPARNLLVSLRPSSCAVFGVVPNLTST
eukprot:CAMPEP_0184729396 /NCGR_PEP_ID=MMETSP0314-20130426/44000_1 /TAXON_ID=38298 /ORGANISM="Rhodella maculata, Strain CCMP 736" /LENGTH=84 /DNA_ID=CAMNT_0027195419 /DNA_START=196 /DNA_END=451 /DNA_ORIENTATION=-